MIRPAQRRPAYGPVLAVVVSSTFVLMIAYTGPLGNITTLAAELSASPATITWMLASMSVGFGVSLLVAGVIADRVGHGRVFGLGAALFGIANVICAIAPDGPILVAGRILAGIGGTGMMATGLGLVAAVSRDATERSRTAIAWSVAMGSGIAVGPIVTGALDLVGGWRFFYAGLALIGAALLGSLRWLPRPAASAAVHRQLDYVGFVLLTTALSTLISAVVQTRAGADRSAAILYAVAFGSTVALVISQRLGPRTLVDPHLFAERPFLAATAAAFGTGIGVIAAMSFSFSIVVVQMGETTLTAGFILSAWAGTSAVAALLFSRLAGRWPGRWQLVAGLLGVGVGIALMGGLDANSGPAQLLPGMVTAGIASGLLNAGLARESVASVPPAHAAMGSGANNTARYVGAAIGITIASVVAGAANSPIAGWNQVAVLTSGASMVIAALVAALSRRASARVSA